MSKIILEMRDKLVWFSKENFEQGFVYFLQCKVKLVSNFSYISMMMYWRLKQKFE